jgi:hypothetical protein
MCVSQTKNPSDQRSKKVGSMEMQPEAIAVRLKALHESLIRFDAEKPCPWELGEIFNTLLEQAKQAAPDDPIVSVMQPAQPGPNEVYVREDSGGLAGKTLQLWRALSRD